MAHFIFSAFCDESGETTIGGQMAACKANGITHMELRGFGDRSINDFTVEEAIAMKKEICHACRKFKTARSLIQIVVYCVEFMIVY